MANVPWNHSGWNTDTRLRLSILTDTALLAKFCLWPPSSHSSRALPSWRIPQFSESSTKAGSSSPRSQVTSILSPCSSAIRKICRFFFRQNSITLLSLFFFFPFSYGVAMKIPCCDCRPRLLWFVSLMLASHFPPLISCYFVGTRCSSFSRVTGCA